MQKLKLFISFFLVLMMVFSFSLHSFGNSNDSTYVWANDSQSVETSSSTSSSTDSLNLESPSAILIEQTTGQILYEHNSHEQLRPASVTKVMSILLIMESISSRKNFFNHFYSLF